MTVTLEQFMADFTPGERAKVEARAAELMGVEQESVSRLERRADLLLSTLSDYVAAMGGKSDRKNPNSYTCGRILLPRHR